MEPTTSVIICTRNRLTDLLLCLKSIKKQVISPTELIIVDSSDTFLTKYQDFNEIIKSLNFEYLYIHTQPGLTLQRNKGIQKAKGELVYFFDDDVVLEPDYIQQMNKAFKENPTYVAGMGDISNLPPVSWRYQLFRTLFLLPRQRSSGNFTWSCLPTHPYGTKKFKQVEVLGGCCMAFRKSILERFNFDENLKGYCYLEDADIGYRISRTNKIFFNPKARLAHFISPASRLDATKKITMFINNYSYLFSKNNHAKGLRFIPYIWSLCGIYLERFINNQKSS